MRKPVRCHAARTLLSQACVSSDGWGDEEAFVVIVLCIQAQRSRQVRRTTVVSAYAMDLGRPQGPPLQASHHYSFSAYAMEQPATGPGDVLA
ncbi:MAG: hypothetical protein KatS3mg056_1427 [Chloroflexus sp.]|nr:MAG: hypothetical protein KatS3mg056_1427 [Chloroflexus sp.]